MKTSYKNFGFSLTEVLMSIGVLAIGMIFVAGVFPVGIYFATVSTERTVAAVVADEAFAKIRLYADPDPDDSGDDIDLRELSVNRLQDFNDVFDDDPFYPLPWTRIDHDPNNYAFSYPSDPTIDSSQKTYCWSALCRASGDPNYIRLVQVTVFVCRKAGGEDYWYKDPANLTELLQGDYPRPVQVDVTATVKPDELIIDCAVDPIEKTFINDGCTIVDNATGRLYRVLERYAPDPETADRDKIILLDRPWNQACTDCEQSVWVVPPPVNGGRNPCIAVYQKLIRF